MTESTARAERYEVQTASSPFYLWEVPQKPVSVRIPFSLIDRLEREAVESFRSLTSRARRSADCWWETSRREVRWWFPSPTTT